MRYKADVILGSLLLLAAWTVEASGQAAPSEPPSTQSSVTPKPQVMFKNVRVFDGKATALSGPSDVLVRGNLIESISGHTATVTEDASVKVIDGAGRTLMPGLIDAHWHATMAAIPMDALMTADYGYIFILAGNQATATLMRGFTSVRDMAGPSFGLKRAIDSGVVPGPRIWPSGAMISQSGGHGDFRFPFEVPRPEGAPLTRGELFGAGIIADGPAQVLQRTREQLMLGASQIKLAAGGGIASNYDPLDVSQYTEAEFHAAVEAADNWGTYVTVHAYTPKAIQTAIHAGVRCIEHGQLMDEDTAKLMAKTGTWLSTQPFLDDADANPYPDGSPNRAKQLQMTQGTDNAYRLAKKYHLKTAWGTDTLFEPKLVGRQGAQLAKMVRWYTPAEVLRMATSTNADLLAMSGPRNPYPGRLGVVEPGALADLLLVDGDPLANIQLVADPDRNFVVIMKNGVVVKDSLDNHH
ncbi:imidazolonepropionase-like amidohydrolase [Luteibacter sp. HA06]|jgi:imidazolonepropionase-like amidohydrolase